METIVGISEAFSMQPTHRRVGSVIGWNDCQEKIILDKIVVEQIFDTGNPYDYYVGYDSQGNKIFAYRVSACNVEYR